MREKFYKFWPLYLSQHFNHINRRLHLISTLYLFFLWIMCGLTGQYIFLFLLPTCYLLPWIGHFFLEENVPKTFSAPLLSFIGDLKLTALQLSGGIDEEFVRLFGTREPVKGSPILVSEDEEYIYQEELKMKVNIDYPKVHFDDYWKVFVLKHRKKINIMTHNFATLWVYISIFLVIISGEVHFIFLMILAPMFGLISHYFTERNHIDFEDAIFSTRAFYCLNKMLLMSLLGRYNDEIKSVVNEVKEIVGQRK